MTVHEKVINGLDCCKEGANYTDPICAKCPYNDAGDCVPLLAADALALLKAQEPRVMTLEEAKSAFVVEYRPGKMREVGSAMLDLDVDPLNAEYGKIYRVWTSRPTDEQREATPWE